MLELNFLFCDHMILQRQKDVKLWGKSDADVKVTVDGTTVTAKAEDGKFTAVLPPHEAGGPYVVRIENGSDVIEINDVYYGEVFLAGGQSNMGLTLKDAMQPLDECELPIRIFTPDRSWEWDKRPETDMQWVNICVENANGISAAASHFAIDIANSQNVPVGILSSNQGASCIRSWISPETIAADPLFAPDVKFHPDAQIFPFNGGSFLYNERTIHVAPYTIRGVIWYQGESDADVCIADKYAYMFDLMVKDWRKLWGDDDLPFIAVQLTYHTVEREEYQWEYLREQQLIAMQTQHNIGMITIGDVGDWPDIHPKNKKTVGQRLAIYARGMIFGEDIVYKPAICSRADFDGENVILTFENAGDGLYETEPHTFRLIMADGSESEARYEINGDKIKLYANGKKPKEVRFCFDCVTEVHLYSSVGLPASPFRINVV